MVAGWFDAEDHYGPFMMYRALVAKSPRNATRLVVGPWSHGGWARGTGESLGHMRFDSKTSEYFRTGIELPFFNHYLKDKGEMTLAPVVAFETGRNRWRTAAEWPPAQAKEAKLHLRTHGRLSFSPSPGTEGDAFDT